MASKKTKTRYLEVDTSPGGFVSKLVSGKDPNFSDVTLLRQVLSDEKARILLALKEKKPQSIYGLAKLLGRDFKSVKEDLKVLEKFGFIEYHSVKTGKREAHKPVLTINRVQIILNV